MPSLWQTSLAQVVFRAAALCYIYSLSSAAGGALSGGLPIVCLSEEVDWEELGMFGIVRSDDRLAGVDSHKGFILYGSCLLPMARSY